MLAGVSCWHTLLFSWRGQVVEAAIGLSPYPVVQCSATDHYFSFGFGLAVERRVALSRGVVVGDLILSFIGSFAALLVVLFDATRVLVFFPPALARARLGELIQDLAAVAVILGSPGLNLMAAA